MKEIMFTCKETRRMINGSSTGKKRASIDFEEPKYCEQLTILNKHYIEGNDLDINREIRRKIIGYKSQDIKKGFTDFITMNVEDIIEKLVCSKLKCHYCRIGLKVLYSKVRDSEQWTLDRIDNDIYHSNENTVICCLGCNLQRRVRDFEKFTFTKQLKVTKADI